MFDGRCGVCTRFVRVMKRLDRKQRITAMPYQKPGVPASAGLTVEACRKAAWAVTPEGRRYRGAGAVNLAVAVALGTNLPHAFYRLPLIQRARPRLRLDRREPSQAPRRRAALLATPGGVRRLSD